MVLISFGAEVSKIGGQGSDIGIFSPEINGHGTGATSCIDGDQARSATIRGADGRCWRALMMIGAQARQLAVESVAVAEAEQAPAMGWPNTTRRSKLCGATRDLWRSTREARHPRIGAAWQGCRNTDARRFAGTRGRQCGTNWRSIASDQDHSSSPARSDRINLRGGHGHHQPDSGDSC